MIFGTILILAAWIGLDASGFVVGENSPDDYTLAGQSTAIDLVLADGFDLLGEEQERITRPIANKAFFDKLAVMPDDTVDGQFGDRSTSCSTRTSSAPCSHGSEPRRNLDLKVGMSSV